MNPLLVIPEGSVDVATPFLPHATKVPSLLSAKKELIVDTTTGFKSEVASKFAAAAILDLSVVVLFVTACAVNDATSYLHHF